MTTTTEIPVVGTRVHVHTEAGEMTGTIAGHGTINSVFDNYDPMLPLRTVLLVGLDRPFTGYINVERGRVPKMDEIATHVTILTCSPDCVRIIEDEE